MELCAAVGASLHGASLCLLISALDSADAVVSLLELLFERGVRRVRLLDESVAALRSAAGETPLAGVVLHFDFDGVGVACVNGDIRPSSFTSPLGRPPWPLPYVARLAVAPPRVRRPRSHHSGLAHAALSAILSLLPPAPIPASFTPSCPHGLRTS